MTDAAMLWCSIQLIRQRKSAMVMEALAKGWCAGARLIDGDPPEDENPFAIYGQTWGAERLIPPALKTGRPFWQIDNGYWRPGRGSPEGYYRFCYRSLSPVYLENAAQSRAALTGVTMAPWRRTGGHILIAPPGGDFGTALGLNMDQWARRIHARVRAYTDRPILLRERGSAISLASQFASCWALVTHSSAIAVEAAIAGVPVFVEPTCAAAPVGNLDLAALENPSMPDNRDAWWKSLMCQQFTPAEMANGFAYRHLLAVRDMVDAKVAA